MATSGLMNAEVIDLQLTGSSSSELSGTLVRRAVELHISENRVDRLLLVTLDHPSFTEAVMTEILDSNPAMLPELGHQSGPRKLLNFIAEKYRYPEAILTIAKDLYTNPDAPDAEFQAFLARHADNEWMLKSLAHLTASTEKKGAALIAVFQKHTEAYDYFIGIQRSLQRQKRTGNDER